MFSETVKLLSRLMLLEMSFIDFKSQDRQLGAAFRPRKFFDSKTGLEAVNR